MSQNSFWSMKVIRSDNNHLQPNDLKILGLPHSFTWGKQAHRIPEGKEKANGWYMTHDNCWLLEIRRLWMLVLVLVLVIYKFSHIMRGLIIHGQQATSVTNEDEMA
jgi:hypothetical protein